MKKLLTIILMMFLVTGCASNAVRDDRAYLVEDRCEKYQAQMHEFGMASAGAIFGGAAVALVSPPAALLGALGGFFAGGAMDYYTDPECPAVAVAAD